MPDEKQEKCIYYCKNNAGEEIDREHAGSPFVFQRSSYQIVKVEGNKRQYTGGIRNENERDQPPYLPSQDHYRIKQHILDKVRHKKHEDPHHSVADNDVAHKVSDSEIRMFVAK